MKKKLMLILLTTFALVGCGGGGSHSEPLLKQPQANTMSVPELKAQDAKKAKEAQDKINNAPVSKGEVDKTVKGLETKITTLEGEVKDLKVNGGVKTSTQKKEINENINVTDKNQNLDKILAKTGFTFENKELITVTRTIKDNDGIGGYGLKADGKGAKAINSGTITLETGQIGMFASNGGIVENKKIINLNGVGKLASQMGMIASGEGSQAKNSGTINLNGEGGIALRAQNGGTITNEENGIINFVGKQDRLQNKFVYPDGGPQGFIMTSKNNIGILIDSKSKFINKGTIILDGQTIINKDKFELSTK